MYQNLNIMHRLKNDNIPKIFTDLIKKPNTSIQQSFQKAAIPQNHSL